MAYVPDAVMDLPLAEVALSDRMYLCNAEPSSFVEASATFCLATITLTPGSGNGSWLIGAGDASGRKLTLEEQTGTGSISDKATHAAFAVLGSSALKFVSTMSDFLVQAGVAFVIPSKDVWEIRDPS